jgi:predicted metal-dependent hydrolase
MRIFSRTKPAGISIETHDHPVLGKITYHHNSSRRTTRLKVEPFTGIQVHLGKGQSPTSAKKIFQDHRQWIKTALKRNQVIEMKSRAFFQDLHILDRSEVKTLLHGKLDQLASTYDFQYNKLTIRDQHTRWGSCSATNNISLNQKLQFLPEELQDYILLHELAHTRQKNHGPQFWKILFDIFGKAETVSRRRRLRDFEYLFYPPPG